MLDLKLIEATIKELEAEGTNFSNCEKLSHLYICRDNLLKNLEPIDEVQRELDDILPYYTKYKEIKKRSQLNQALDIEVIQGIEDVCKELKEFIEAIYSSTDMNKERVCIKSMISQLSEKYMN